MKKITQKDIKDFWEKNKAKIIIGGSAAVGLTSVIIYSVMRKDHNSLEPSEGYGGGFTFWRNEPSRKIPFVDGFTIQDIAEDANDGLCVWLDGCKLSDCGKLGEGLSKIERVNPEMLITMAILAKDEVEWHTEPF